MLWKMFLEITGRENVLSQVGGSDDDYINLFCDCHFHTQSLLLSDSIKEMPKPNFLYAYQTSFVPEGTIAVVHCSLEFVQE